MPELPEVETIRVSLDPVVVGLTVTALELRSPRLRLPLGPELREAVVGRRITATSRRGKYLLLHLDDGGRWLFHMGMSGRLRFLPMEEVERGRHDHVVAVLGGDACRGDAGVAQRRSDGRQRDTDTAPRRSGAGQLAQGAPRRGSAEGDTERVKRRSRAGQAEQAERAARSVQGALVFHDPRRFGVCSADATVIDRLLVGMGPEPLDAAAFHADHLLAWRARSDRTIKDVLMDQRVVAGLGNIYVSEILFRAGLRPRRRLSRIARTDLERIVECVREVIAAAIAEGGSTISDFLDGIGRRGGYQGYHLVYDREGQPCPRCSTPIRMVVVGQRSSFYCPRCQR